MRFVFLTATPPNIAAGSGTYVGVSNLARGLQQLGHSVEIVSPITRLPNYTLSRWLFNRQLRSRRFSAHDVIVGFDLDGYRLPPNSARLHIAALKGVVADEARFERGYTRWSMNRQADWERQHVRRADLVLTTSEYSAQQIVSFYGIEKPPAIVPESIDLERWSALLRANVAPARTNRFVVLSVCRFYRRKRLDLLLAAAAHLRAHIPGLELRIVGGGPEAKRLHRLARALRLHDCVVWLQNIPLADLAREYNGCDLFCLPSVQEGFGIVFLEAMAAGKPIVAARAAAVPEVAGHAILTTPDDPADLARGIEAAYCDSALRERIAREGQERVQQFELSRVTRHFLQVVQTALAMKSVT